MRQALGREEGIRCDTQGCAVVKPAPATPFEMVEAHLVLELLVIPFDAPAQQRELHQIAAYGRRRQRRQPMLRGRVLGTRPFDSKPLFRSRRAKETVPL